MAQSGNRSVAPRAVSSWMMPKGVKFGDTSRLKLMPIQETDEENTLKVATRAVGLNFADVFTILGYYKAANLVRTSTNDAFVPGLEFAGIVLEDSSDGEFKRGDRVYGFTRFGAYSDIVHAKPSSLRRLPDNWTYEQGAAFLVNALTAFYGLVVVAGMPNISSIQDRDGPFVVVVQSAAGGVGLLASEIAARRGAIVVGIVGSESKTNTFYERISPLCPHTQCLVRRDNANEYATGLATAICRARSQATGLSPPQYNTAADLVEAGWGCDVLMESYGGKYFNPSLNLMNPCGSIATYGSTTYNGSPSNKTRLPFLPLVWKYLRRPMLDPGELIGRNVRVGGFNLIFLTENTRDLSKVLQDCITCLSGNDNGDSLEAVTPPVVGHVFGFDNEAVDALTALRSGATVGKVVLSNPNNPALSNVPETFMANNDVTSENTETQHKQSLFNPYRYR